MNKELKIVIVLASINKTIAKIITVKMKNLQNSFKLSFCSKYVSKFISDTNVKLILLYKFSQSTTL